MVYYNSSSWKEGYWLSLVYKIKCKSDGSLERYEAYLVAKEYTQLEGVDYHDTFSPTAKMIIVHCLLTLVAAQH